MTVLDTPEKIAMMRLLTLRAGLRLEVRGMMMKTAPSCYTIVKREFGFIGGKQKVLKQLNEHIFKLQQQELDLNDGL